MNAKKIKKLHPNQKTCTRFKTSFTEAHQELREERQTIRSAGYSSANNVFENENQMAVALANLASATTADRNTIATLTETNAKLVSEIAKLTKKLSELAMKQSKKEKKKRDGSEYCWSCGYKVNHTSKNCRWKKQGHKDEATANDTMGGSTWS